MKIALVFALAALGATGIAAYADQADHMMVMRHHGPMMEMDANHDGWITRDEAAAGADRMFDHLDTNHDGRLTDADRPHMGHAVDMHFGDAGSIPGADDRNCTRTAEGDRVTIICTDDDGAEAGDHVERRVIVRHGDHAAPHADAERHVEREVTIITRGDDDEDDAVAPPAPPAPPAAPHAAHAPLPPHPPHPPMFMMLMANTDEMDTNHDGAISREEFRAQHLRFFDASDANGDGRIRFEPPPVPPVPPVPPTAPPAPTPPPAPR